MSNHALSRSLRSIFCTSVLLFAPMPLACAVATEPELGDDDGGMAGGLAHGGMSAGTGPVVTYAGSNAFGGTSSPATGGNPSVGSPSTAGRGGVSGGGGKPGGQAGMSSAGMSAGGASGGGAGASSNGCGTLKSWKGGDPNLTIAAGEVIQWMGKRYKATVSIAYPNAECAPDAPAMWCAAWFTAGGNC
jgi:hypothetical protein